MIFIFNIIESIYNFCEFRIIFKDLKNYFKYFLNDLHHADLLNYDLFGQNIQIRKSANNTFF